MPKESNKPQNIINKLKLPPSPEDAPHSGHSGGKDCPGCSTKGARQAGFTHCAYCGYEFGKIQEHKQ